MEENKIGVIMQLAQLTATYLRRVSSVCLWGPSATPPPTAPPPCPNDESTWRAFTGRPESAVDVSVNACYSARPCDKLMTCARVWPAFAQKSISAAHTFHSVPRFGQSTRNVLETSRFSVSFVLVLCSKLLRHHTKLMPYSITTCSSHTQ